MTNNVSEYEERLRKLAGATYSDQPSDEFIRLDSFGIKNAEFLNQFPADVLYRTLWCNDKYYRRPDDWSDHLWKREIQNRVCMAGSSSPALMPPSFEGDHIKGFEVVYAAGSILEFRLKVKKGVWMSDGQWHNYFVPCRFIDGDVRPYMDGQLLKPSLLLKIQKKYHYSR